MKCNWCDKEAVHIQEYMEHPGQDGFCSLRTLDDKRLMAYCSEREKQKEARLKEGRNECN